MQEFIEVTITADNSDTSAKVRRAAIRIDQITSLVDVSAEELLDRPKTRLHLSEPTDFESDTEAGGVVRSTRQVFVREDYDTIRRRIAEAGQG